MQLYLLLGSEQVADVNVEEAVVVMVPGDVGRYLIGILAVMIILPVLGKHIIRSLFPQVAPMHCPTAKFFAFPAIRILAHTVGTD